MERSVIRGRHRQLHAHPDFASLHPGYNDGWFVIDENFVPGGTFFFTVTLADRHSSALVTSISLLRHAFRTTRRERPFSVDAIVVLPDHLHIVMTLPSDDSDFPGRWKRIKSLFTRHAVARGIACERNRRGEYALWQRRFWEHTVRDEIGPCSTRRLHPLQSRQTRARSAGWRLAALVLSSLREAWRIAERLGRHRCKKRGLRRACRLNPDCASLHPGYSLSTCGRPPRHPPLVTKRLTMVLVSVT